MADRNRADRVRLLARSIKGGPAEQRVRPLITKLELVTRAAQDVADGDWDDDCNHLAQGLDAVLDEALKAFQGGQVDQGVALIVSAAATGDALLEALNQDDADEDDPGTAGRSAPVPTRPPIPPRDNLIRAIHPGYELREDDSGTGGMPTLIGHFAIFDEWTEIDSVFEGRFLERISAGTFQKTFKESRDKMRVLFQHGQDPQVGNKPLGPIQELREDSSGGYYEVPLLDTSYNRDLLPGLQAGLYGASFRFRVTKEEFDTKPKRSAYNPEGLPERTIKEAEVREFGPVTFPAYPGATASVRSLTDEFVLSQFLREPERLRQLLQSPQATVTTNTTAPTAALPGVGAEVTHSSEGSRDDPPRPAPLKVIRNPNRSK